MEYAAREPLYLSLKALDDEDERIFEGYASTEALDQQGEIVTKAALRGAIPYFLKHGKITENHDVKKPIGVPLTAEVDDHGLKVTGRVVKGVKHADEAWAMIKQGVYNGLSIGFRYDRSGVSVQGGKRVFKSIKKLFDCAVTAYPVNEEAYMLAVKSEGCEIEPETSPAETWVAAQLEGAEDEWRAVAKSACVLFGARGGCELDADQRQEAFGLLKPRYEALEKSLPEFEGDWPESFKAVAFQANEQHIYEEETAGSNLQEIARRAADVQSITQHWAKEGLQLSEATKSQIRAAADALEALLAVGAQPELTPAELLAKLLTGDE